MVYWDSGRRALKSGRRPRVLLVFGEDENDQDVIKLLVGSIRVDAPRVEKRRRPLILMKDRNAANRRKNAQRVAQQVTRDQVRFEVRGVIAHQDCDAVEPAHIALSESIENALASVGVSGIAATPAWEMEAWLFLWPDAAPHVVKSWSRPRSSNSHVGLVRNAKEAYRRALGSKSKRSYEESDAPKIVSKACELGIIGRPACRSDSYERFRVALLRMKL